MILLTSLLKDDKQEVLPAGADLVDDGQKKTNCLNFFYLHDIGD